MRLCPACRADPANVGWNESTFIVGGKDDAAALEPVAVPHGARELMASRPRRRGPKPIMRERIARALVERRTERVRKIDARGNYRGYYERLAAPSYRQIARELGCSHTLVLRVKREIIAMGQRQQVPRSATPERRRCRPPADVDQAGVRFVRVEIRLERPRRDSRARAALSEPAARRRAAAASAHPNP